MKSSILALSLFCLPCLVLAAEPANSSTQANSGQTASRNSGYPPALDGVTPPAVRHMTPDYFGPDTVPLTRREREALRLSRQWAGQGLAPVMSFAGKLIYVHGSGLPTILGSPMQVSDVELEPGEKVHEIVLGDSARWMLETGATGSGDAEQVHLFIKPVDVGLETSAVVTTDRRVYHLRLISKKSGHTPYVGFSYSDQVKLSFEREADADAHERHWNSTQIDGKIYDLSELNFEYVVSGKAKWAPERIYDNSSQMFIKFPSKLSEMPILLVRKGSKDILVNYRIKNQAIIVDGLFDKMTLVLGVGSDKEEITISKKN